MVRAFIPALHIDDRAAWEAWWMGADRGGVWREQIRKPCAGCGSWFSGAWQPDGSIGIEAHVCSVRDGLEQWLRRLDAEEGRL